MTSEDQGPGKRTDAEIVAGMKEGDEAMLAGVSASGHPRSALISEQPVSL